MEHDNYEERIAGVSVVRWNPVRDHNEGERPINNFGDLLGPLIVSELVDGVDEPVERAGRLVGLGSVLHFARSGDVVWGTGVNGKIPDKLARLSGAQLDVRAVRGPLTLGVLRRVGISAPRLFGDPALLLPSLRPDLFLLDQDSRRGIVDVPNLNDEFPVGRGEMLVPPTLQMSAVLRAISEAEMVIASSLHAIIIAESLGIPARAYRSAAEGTFKYLDYYLGTGRTNVIIAGDRDEALRLGGAPPPEMDLVALRDAFPMDLWGAPRAPRRPNGAPISAEVAAGYLRADANARASGLIIADAAELRTGVLASFTRTTGNGPTRTLLAQCITAYFDDQSSAPAALSGPSIAGAISEASRLAEEAAAPKSTTGLDYDWHVQSKPLVSVVVPVYNVEEWLDDCLASIKAQSYERWEAIVVIDGSTDGSTQIAHRFAAEDDRFTVLEFENGGLARARNRGLDAASGTYVTFIDSDDIVPVGALEAYVSMLEETGSDIVTGRAEQLRADGTIGLYWTMASGLHGTRAVRATNVLREPRLVLDHTTWNKAFTRAFLIENGIRHPDDAPFGEDVMHNITAYLAASSVDITPEVVYRHRRRPGSLTASLMQKSAIEGWLAQTNIALDQLISDAPEAVIDEYLSRMLRNEAWTRAQGFEELHDPDHIAQVRTLFERLLSISSPAVLATVPATRLWAYRGYAKGEDAVAGLMTSPFPMSRLDDSALKAIHASDLGVPPGELLAELWRSTSLRAWAWAHGLEAADSELAVLRSELNAAGDAVSIWPAQDRRMASTILSGSASELERLRTLVRESKTAQLDHFDEGRLQYFVHVVVHPNLRNVIDRASLHVRGDDGELHHLTELAIRRHHQRKVILTGSFVKLRWRSRHGGKRLVLTVSTGADTMEIPLQLRTTTQGILQGDARGVTFTVGRKD